MSNDLTQQTPPYLPTQQAAATPGATDKPAWTEQLQMPNQPGAAPELASPVPPQIQSTVPVSVPNAVAPPITQIKVPGLPVMGVEPQAPKPAVLPAIPAAPPVASGKCITEGCKSKTRDRGMCARCLKDTLLYMDQDPNVTWEFLEANDLALPASGAASGNKFRLGLTSKLAALHAAAGKTS